MENMVEVLNQVVWSSHTTTVAGAQMHDLFQTNSVANIVFQALQGNIGLIALIREIRGR